MKKSKLIELKGSLQDYKSWNKKKAKIIDTIIKKLDNKKSKFNRKELYIVSTASYESLFD